MSSQPPNPAQPQVVSGAEIVGTLPPPELTLQPLEPLQRAGFQLAVGVGVFSALLLLLVFGVWASRFPQPPALVIDTTNGSQVITDTAKALENYREAVAIVSEQPQKWLEVVFVGILYPLFTLLLGYIFGARSQGNESGGG